MISVIIPTCNRSNLLRLCLDCLLPSYQSLLSTEYEVIVTDDSKDETSKIMIEDNYKWVKWVQGPKKGPAANRNNGAKYAKGEWLVFTDDDCLPQKSWLRSYLAAIQTTGFLVLEGKTTADRPQIRFDEESPINIEGDRLWSCNFSIQKDLFNGLNGFDESFPYAAMEDVDLYTRIRKQTDILFISNALVTHPWRQVRSFHTFMKHLKSHKYFIVKHGYYFSSSYRWSRFKIFLGSIVSDFRKLLQFSMRGWPIYIEKCILNFFMIFL